MGTYYYAVSDVISSGSLNGSTLSVNINSSVDASSPIAFMAAKSNGTDCFLPFKHFSGLLQFNYSYTPKNKNFQFESIQIVADNPLCGAFDITFDENGVPTAHSQSGSSNTFTYNTTATSGTVYFPIMPGSYSSFDIIFSARQTKSNQLATYQVSFNNENNQTLDIVRGQKRVIGGTISWVQQ